MQTDYDRITALIAYIEANFEQQPSLSDLASQANLSEYHLQRLFSRWAGISPKRFLQYLTAQSARERLQNSHSILCAAYEVGLSGGGRLHDLMVNIYAMTPGELQNGGAGLSIRYGFGLSPFGLALVGLTERGVCWLTFMDDELQQPQSALDTLRAEWPNADYQADDDRAQNILDQIFDTEQINAPLSVAVKGTNFQVRVWEALLKIPTGALTTYGDLAASLGQPSAARAVGGAVGKNAIAYLIPCHRVIRSSGLVGEYRWGATRKKALLAWEAAQRFPEPNV